MATTDLDYAKVTGRFGLVVGDTSDPGDEPDTIWCDEGKVYIQPLQTFTKVADATEGNFTAGNAVIEASIGPDGRLTYLGKPYVYVVDLTSDKVNPQIGPNKATHRIRFDKVKADGTLVNFPELTVRITKDGPSGDGVNDLYDLAPVVPGTASPIYRGETGTGILGVAIVDSDQLQVELTDGTIVDAGTLPAGPGGSNAGVAGYVTNDGPTKTALTATIDASVEPVGRLIFAPAVAARPGNQHVALGDSIDRGNTDDPTPGNGKTNLAVQANPWTLAAMRSNGHFRLKKNAGITGQRADQMLSRFDTDVVAYGATSFSVGAGTNEIQQGVSFETYRSNVTAIMEKGRQAGIPGMIRSVLPLYGDYAADAAKWARWQGVLAAELGVPFLDAYALMVDPATGELRAGVNSGDYIHPGFGGMIELSTLYRDALVAIMPTGTPSLLAWNTDPAAILSNGLYLGTPSGDGLPPSWSWEAKPTGASASVQTDAAVLGKVLRVEKYAVASDIIVQQGVGLAGNSKVAVGDVIKISGRCWFKNQANGAKSGVDIIRIDFGTGTPRDLYSMDYWADGWMTYEYDLTVPVGATQVKWMYVGRGDGFADFAQTTVINATRGELLIGAPTL